MKNRLNNKFSQLYTNHNSDGFAFELLDAIDDATIDGCLLKGQREVLIDEVRRVYILS